MPILRLEITDIRNISSIQLSLHPLVNIFYGVNGSGKTSVLESAHIIGLGRSFRSSKIKPIVKHGAGNSTVYAVVGDELTSSIPIGVTRGRGAGTVIKVSNKSVDSAACLAEILPLQVVNSDTFQLLEGGPKQRRQFIDWGVFHVEHSFLEVWRHYQKILKQRNTLLRADRVDFQQIESWDSHFVKYANQIDGFRSDYLQRLEPLFSDTLASLNHDLSAVGLEYKRGWDSERSIEELLRNGLISDKNQGFTRVGPHRADMKIKYGSDLASDILSRGQQKLVVYALRIAQGKMLKEETGKVCTFLLDDLPSELDEQHQQRLCDLLESIGSQVLITCVDKESMNRIWSEKGGFNMFHVKHGEIE